MATSDEQQIRLLVENWAHAVRTKNVDGILAHHAADILLFDVPPPLASRGLDAYRKSWDVYFEWSGDLGVFDITAMDVTAGDLAAFVTALLRCAGTEKTGERTEMQFRLTVGLRKNGDQWTVVHEHHSVPAT